MAKIKCPECDAKYAGNFCPNCSAPAPEGAKKKKKKWLLPVIVIAVVVLLIAGMGGKEDVQQPSQVQGDSSVTPTQAVTPAEPATTESTQSAPSTDVTIEETELYNANGVTVTATELKDSLFGPEVTVTISNETEKNIVVVSRELSVNGYMLSASSLYGDVAAGKKSIETIHLMSSELSEAGIETVADIEFLLHIYDADTFDDIDTSGLITLSTSASEGFTQPVDDSGDVIYDDKNIRVICKGLKDDVIWDGCVVFYVENNSDKTVTVYSENVSVNGFMVDESLWSDLRPGTRAIDAMYLLTLDEIGLESIDAVENIEFNLRIIDEKWNEIATTDVITLNFN